MSDAKYTQAQILLIKADEDEAALHLSGISESILGFHANKRLKNSLKRCWRNFRFHLS
jgi:hypothetical protein